MWLYGHYYYIGTNKEQKRAPAFEVLKIFHFLGHPECLFIIIILINCMDFGIHAEILLLNYAKLRFFFQIIKYRLVRKRQECNS